MDGIFECSDELYAYDVVEDTWEKIVPKSDEDANACTCERIYEQCPVIRASGILIHHSASRQLLLAAFCCFPFFFAVLIL